MTVQCIIFNGEKNTHKNFRFPFILLLEIYQYSGYMNTQKTVGMINR